tara:strand:+ start:1436 stop:1603 length:168 start_codon:yes stop_codon:yes gene_type:complete
MGKKKETTWDIRVEGKQNKNNIIFQDKAYYKLYLELKKENDRIKEIKGVKNGCKE